MLSRALPELDPEQDDASYGSKLFDLNNSLPNVFETYAEKRQPRTAALVKGARAQGQQRVVTTGSEDCRERNERVKAAWADTNAIRQKYDTLLREPFQHSLQ